MTIEATTDVARDPIRRCAATGERAARAAMVRFVRGPDGAVVPDLAARLPGRGAWVAARREAVARARLRGGFARALGAGATAGDDFEDRVDALLGRRVLDLLGLARRAGAVGVGFEAVRAFAKAGKVALVFAASDGSPGSLAKLAAMVGPTPLVPWFSAEELGHAVGYGAVVQVAVRPGGPAERLAAEVARLAGFRAVGDDGRLPKE